MFDSYKDKWDRFTSHIPNLPFNMTWLKDFFSKEKLPDLSDLSLNKGKCLFHCYHHFFDEK